MPEHEQKRNWIKQLCAKAPNKNPDDQSLEMYAQANNSHQHEFQMQSILK